MRKCVLVVEDEPDIIMLIQRSLSLKNFMVIQAGSGTQALEFFDQRTPDLVLLDIMMPDMDGFEVCQKIKAKPEGRNVPVVFLTVRSNEEDIARSKSVGASGYITKPFDPFKLVDEIEKILV
jgi:DNA-binding response OmpR family regulator